MARPLRTSDNSQLHGLVLRRYGDVGVRRQVCQMLAREPQGLGKEIQMSWRKIEPLNVNLLEEYWDKLNSGLPLFDYREANYDEWE